MVSSMDYHLFQPAKQNIHLHIYWQENQLVLSHSPFPDFHIHYSVKQTGGFDGQKVFSPTEEIL